MKLLITILASIFIFSCTEKLIVLDETEGSVKGKLEVYDKYDNRVKDLSSAKVFAIDGDSVAYQTKCSSDGEFQFNNLKRGVYSFYAEYNGRKSRRLEQIQFFGAGTFELPITFEINVPIDLSDLRVENITFEEFTSTEEGYDEFGDLGQFNHFNLRISFNFNDYIRLSNFRVYFCFTDREYFSSTANDYDSWIEASSTNFFVPQVKYSTVLYRTEYTDKKGDVEFSRININGNNKIAKGTPLNMRIGVRSRYGTNLHLLPVSFLTSNIKIKHP